MVVSNALRELAGVLDELEGGSVTSVESADRLDGEMTLTAEVELPLTTESPNGDGPGLVLADATVDADGTLTFAVESIAPVGSRLDDVAIEPTDVTLTDDGPPTVTLATSVTVDGEAGTGGESNVDDPSPVEQSSDDHPDEERAVADDSTDSTARRRDRDVPPFRDPELLAEVYESCDTFAEMADELDMDVTAETVRRYMVDHDIHQPNTYETSDDEESGTGDDDGTAATGNGQDDDGMATAGGQDDDGMATAGNEQGGAPDGHDAPDASVASVGDDQQPPVALPDGIGLPDDVTVDSFIETIRRSNTIYEVKRDVGIDQDDALDMLRELNLLDLVVGCLATEAERDIRREEIIERLREASAAQ